jgi:predicted RND superfamily exporter protein
MNHPLPQPGHWIRAAIAYRWWLAVLAVLLGLVSYPLARQLSFDRGIENMFAPDDPLLPPFAKLKRTFGGNELVLAVYQDPRLMTADGLARLAKLDKQLEQVPGVLGTLSMVKTPLGTQIINANNPLARQFLSLLEGYVVGADRQTVGVACLLDPQSPIARSELVDQLRRTVVAHDAGGLIVGEPVMVVDGFRYLEDDGFLLGVVSTGLLLVVMWLCFRSVRWLVVPLVVVQLALLATQATLVAAGVRLSMVSSMMTAIITIVGISTIVHVIVRFRDARQQGLLPADALAQAAAILAAPVTWSILTDMAGFSSLMISRVGPVQDFGLMMALGAAWVLVCLVLVVPSLALVGRSNETATPKTGPSQLERGLGWLAVLVEKYPRPLAWGTVIVVAASAAGLGRLQVETDFTKNFRATSPIVQSYAFVEQNLGGAGVWDVIVPVPSELDEAFLTKLRVLQQRLRDETAAVVVSNDNTANAGPLGLSKVLSVVDLVDAGTLGLLDHVGLPALRWGIIRRALGELDSRMPAFYGALVGSDPQSDQTHVRIMLRAAERTSADAKRKLIDEVTRIAQEEFPAAQTTGFYVLLAALIESTTRDQWTTFAVAGCAILAMAVLALRDVKLALVALIPNALPVFIVTGLMGWLGLKINMGAAMIASVSLGLSIDASMHYLFDFKCSRAAGRSVREAIQLAHRNVGRAVVLATLALVVGFSALCFSQFVPTIYFGALVGLTMLGGLAGNLIVLPLLLVWTQRNGN